MLSTAHLFDALVVPTSTVRLTGMSGVLARSYDNDRQEKQTRLMLNATLHRRRVEADRTKRPEVTAQSVHDVLPLGRA